jgi:hypothetical protein
LPPNAGGYPPPKPKKKGGCGGCLITVLVVLLVLGLLGVGGYWAFSSGVISQGQLLALVGRAPGEISVINFGEKTLSARLTRLDASESSDIYDETIQLEPLDMDGFSMDQGRYRLVLTFASAPPVTCTLRIDSDDFYQVSATANVIFISNDKKPARTGSDLRMPGSPLCQQ